MTLTRRKVRPYQCRPGSLINYYYYYVGACCGVVLLAKLKGVYSVREEWMRERREKFVIIRTHDAVRTSAIHTVIKGSSKGEAMLSQCHGEYQSPFRL